MILKPKRSSPALIIRNLGRGVKLGHVWGVNLGEGDLVCFSSKFQNEMLLGNYFLPGDLEAQIEALSLIHI